MSAGDGAFFSNISATTDPFPLDGGVYVVDALATWSSGTVTLQRLGPDGANYLTAATALSADGTSGGVVLSRGTYRFAVATATGVYVGVSRVPGS